LTTINVNNLVSTVNRYYSTLLIDNPANLRNHRVYVYSGTLDTVIRSCKAFFDYLNYNKRQ